MASRAESGVELARQRPRGPFRAALTDFYFDSLRLVRANLVWAAGLILAVVLALGWPLGGLIVMVLLALPTAGVFRTAANIVRADPVAARHELRWAYGGPRWRLLAVGVALVVAGAVCAWNVVAGLAAGGLAGWAFATLAVWGLVASWCAAIAVWPILVDPMHEARDLRDDLGLAAQVLLTEPRRVAGLAITSGVVVLVSIVLTAAILTVAVAFVALLACRTVYPIVDRLEALPTVPVGPTG